MTELIQLTLVPDQATLTRIEPDRNQWRLKCVLLQSFASVNTPIDRDLFLRIYVTP